MQHPHNDIPDPIARNRRERRLAWLLAVVLLALALLIVWRAPADVRPGAVADPPMRRA